jgi:hypothetical protein
MSLRVEGFFGSGRMALALAGLLAALPMGAQYPGQVAKSAKDAPELRSIAVLEWTGDPDHPKASRLVPVTLLDAGVLQDGSIYLARPVPLALAGDVEYEIQENGKPKRLFDVHSAGMEMGAWVGHGATKPIVVGKPKAEKQAPRAIEDENSDRPVLHRKHHATEDSGNTKGGDSGDDPQSGSSASQADSDPDRPKLHKKDSGDNPTASSDAGAGSGASSDPDRPVLRKKTTDESSDRAGSSSTSSVSVADSDRPVLKKNKKKPAEEDSVSSFDSTDPDRPHLKRGKPSSEGPQVAPTMLGLPPEMEQAVAVSDIKSRPEHSWSFTWADPGDEAKMKAAMEDLARNALGLNPPPQLPAPQPKRPAVRKAGKPATPPPQPEPAPLLDEHFRVFELAYGSGATLVLSARTDAPPQQQKFVTLVAQPDLYGNLMVLLKSVSDAAHLDETPPLHLIDAVDALADNRGELLFELRGATQRQFVLYRILRGRAEKLFASGEAFYGTANRD